MSIDLETIGEGILPVDKPSGQTSFSLVRALRKLTKIQKIGHAGTLDPLASGVMILLIGRKFTQKADSFINQDKEYEATIQLGEETTTYDAEGEVVNTSDKIPIEQEVIVALNRFQGTIEQIPPMHSAKKVNGKKLYQLARKGVEIERQPIQVTLTTNFISYSYPEIKLSISCSKGTYIRTIAQDIGKILGCGAHLKQLIRTRCGPYTLQDCLDGKELFKETNASTNTA